MTDPNTAVIRALGLPDIFGSRCIGMTIRLVPLELPVAELTMVIGIDQDEQQTEVQRFNIVPIEE